MSASSASTARSRCSRSPNGERPASAARAAPTASSAPASPARASTATRGRLAVGGRVGQPVLLGLERAVLVGVVEGRGVELVDLVAQQVHLSRPRSRIATERRELGVELRDARPRGSQRRQIDPAEAVERASAARPPPATTGGCADHGGRRGARPSSASCATVASRPFRYARDRPSRGMTRPSTSSVSSTTNRPSIVHSDAPCRTTPAVGPPSDEQLDGVDEQGLARAGLAGERGHAGAEHEHELVDDAEVANRQLDQHSVSDRSGRT